MNNNNENHKLLNATEPSWKNRGDYVGRVKQTEQVEVVAEDGTVYRTEKTFFVSWDSIKAILGLARNKAGITNDPSVSSQQESNGRGTDQIEQSGSISSDDCKDS